MLGKCVGEVCVCGEVFEVSGVLEEVGRKRENLESGLGHKDRAGVLLHGRIETAGTVRGRHSPTDVLASKEHLNLNLIRLGSLEVMELQ